MAEALLDTTVLVDLGHGYEPAVSWLRVHPHRDDLVVSVLSWFELIAGCRSRREELRLDRLLGHFQVIPVAETDCSLALRWYRRFHLSDGVGALDCLIAAAAFRLSTPLVSSNTRHFKKLPGIKTRRAY